MLKVAHHGSRNGTDLTFARAVSPQYAVISYGVGNSYGHPHKEALAALTACGARILATATEGNVTFTSDGERVTYTTSHTAPAFDEGPQSVTVAPAAVSPPTSNRDSGGYIGNLRTKVFHRASCSSLPAEKNRVYFNTREEAINAGYRPCKELQAVGE